MNIMKENVIIHIFITGKNYLLLLTYIDFRHFAKHLELHHHHHSL